MTRHRPGPYGPPPADSDQVQAWLRDNDLVDTMHRRGLLVRRPHWRPGRHLSLDERIATDPQQLVADIADHVASHLRATGQAVTIPADRQTLRDRYRPLGPVGAAFAGGMAAVLVVALIACLVLVAT